MHTHLAAGRINTVQISGFDVELLGVPIACGSYMQEDAERLETGGRGSGAGEILPVNLFITFGDETDFVLSDCAGFISLTSADKTSLEDFAPTQWSARLGYSTVFTHFYS